MSRLARNINAKHADFTKYRYLVIGTKCKSYYAIREPLVVEPKVNTLKGIQRHAWLDQNEKRSPSGSAVPIPIPNHVNKDLKIVLDTCQNSQQIVSLIKRHENEIVHASIYGKAMQKCRKLRDFHAVQHIMELLLKRDDLEKSVVEFSIYINSMALSEWSYRCIYYFKLMVSKYNIQPNEILFASLLKSFKTKIQWKEAEKVWDMMLNQFKVEPNEAAYSAMMAVYSASRQKEKANKLLTEYLEKHPNNKQGHVGIFGSYINLFSKLGDMKEMKKAMKLGTKHGLQITNELIASIMTCYYANGKYQRVVDVFNDWIDGGNTPNRHIFFLKCVALTHLIGSCKNGFDGKQRIYNQLQDTLYGELNNYGVKLDQALARTQLNGAIFLYHNHDPQEIVKVFERLCNKNLMGYLADPDKPELIDLHLLDFVDAQFILRYVFAYKLDEILKDGQDRLCIITGKGKHTWTEGKGTMQGSMYKFIAKELASWDPPIIVPDTSGSGRIEVYKHQLDGYLNNANNYAKQKFSIPSDDWYKHKERKSKRKDTKNLGEIQEEEKYSELYGDVNRKRASPKLMEQLKDHLKEGQIFKIVNGDKNEEIKYKVMKHVDKANFIVLELDNKIEKQLNMTSVLYKLLL